MAQNHQWVNARLKSVIVRNPPRQKVSKRVKMRGLTGVKRISHQKTSTWNKELKLNQFWKLRGKLRRAKWWLWVNAQAKTMSTKELTPQQSKKASNYTHLQTLQIIESTQELKYLRKQSISIKLHGTPDNQEKDLKEV